MKSYFFDVINGDCSVSTDLLLDVLAFIRFDVSARQQPIKNTHRLEDNSISKRYG